VDSQGHQLQATSHEGARPFNAKELDGMARVNVCASCHGWMLDPEFWQGLYSWYGKAAGQQGHDRLLKGLLGRKGAAP
jgi:mono/diheme cytochrome c family protein